MAVTLFSLSQDNQARGRWKRPRPRIFPLPLTPFSHPTQVSDLPVVCFA